MMGINGTCNATLDDLRIGRSEVVMAGGMTFHQIGIIVSAGCALIACLFSFYLIIMHALHYTKPREQRHIIRILFMVPIYSIASFLTFIYYWHAIYFQVMFECYEAFAIASFFALLCHYIAPDLHEQKQYFRGMKPRSWVLPLNWFKKCCGGDRGPWRTPRSGLTWFNIIWSGIYQYCFIRVTMTITAVITQYFGKYCESSNSPVFAHIWILVIEGLAVTVAMYCVIQFYVQLRVDLAPHKPFLKVAAIKLVIFLSFWQSFAISILTSSTFNIVKVTSTVAYPDLKIGIPSLLLCVEMAIFSVLHIFAFPWKPYYNAGVTNYPISSPGGLEPDKIGPKQGGFLGIKAIADAMNPWDLVKAFARGVRWMFVGRKHREKDASYNPAFDLNNPNNENDMTLGAGANGYKRTETLPIADEFRRSKFGMPGYNGSTTKVDDEGAGLISHAQPNPLANTAGGAYVPARQRYDENGQDISQSRYDSHESSPDRLSGRNPSPDGLRRQENAMVGQGGGGYIGQAEPYRSHVQQQSSQQGFGSGGIESDAYREMKRQERMRQQQLQQQQLQQQEGRMQSPSQQWANSSQPIGQPQVHNALWGGQSQGQPPTLNRNQNSF